VTETATNVIDIWPYVASIPSTDLRGQRVQHELVECVYRSDDDRFDHVLVMTHTKNVYLVVGIDLSKEMIFGHHLLDLNVEYGLRPADS
jgi:hypothetical protein